jgi:hypothetical protein
MKASELNQVLHDIPRWVAVFTNKDGDEVYYNERLGNYIFWENQDLLGIDLNPAAIEFKCYRAINGHDS